MSINNKNSSINTQSFLTALGIIFLLMFLTYLLTLIIPGGQYTRTIDSLGNTVIDIQDGFTFIDGGISFIKWIFSPILVLFSKDSVSIIAILLFLCIIGGIFNCLDKCGLMKYILDLISIKFYKQKYKLLAITTLFFMLLGSLVGSFEECVPLVPIVCALSLRLGWNHFIGLGMSILACGCGFAAGICNPFTIGVAQQLANLPMFSAMGYRIVAFICVYVLLLSFLYLYAKKIDTNQTSHDITFTYQKNMNYAFLAFVILLSIGIICVLSSTFIPQLQDYTMIIVAIMFLLAGITATFLSKMHIAVICKEFIHGVISMLPAILMILMANSIKFTLEEAKILDTLLYYGIQFTQNLPNWSIILFIYFIVLVSNFFIPSGSAKAFLLIPLLLPITQIFNISSQLLIMAFAFGDGFSNIFYPTNPVLLISLNLANVDYSKWIRWSYKFQLLNLIMTSFLLLIGLYIGY